MRAWSSPRDSWATKRRTPSHIPQVFWGERFFFVFTRVVLAGGVVLVVAPFWRRGVDGIKRRQENLRREGGVGASWPQVGATADRIDGDSIRRFDVHQRIQHIMMFSSFIMLAITGLPMKFSEWAISQWWIGVWGGIDNMRAVHHAAAWIMIASCVYHLVVPADLARRVEAPVPHSHAPRAPGRQGPRSRT